MAVGVALAGCYSLQPVGTTPPEPGSRIALDITDIGRVALGGSMGPEIAQIEGRLIQHDDSGYVVGVTALHLLSGGQQVWTGEHVRLKPEYVRSVYERQLSKGRTLVAGAVGVAAVAAIVATSLKGSATSEEPKPPPDTGAAQRRPGSMHIPQRSPAVGPRSIPQIIRP